MRQSFRLLAIGVAFAACVGCKKKAVPCDSREHASIEPIFGREGHLGGIESITVAGTRYWFGFDFGGDFVLSPPLADADVMARFASLHMVQRDGGHPPPYWREQALNAVSDSELASDPGDRDFSGHEVSSALAELTAARAQARRVRDLKLSHHLRYLLAATAADDWETPCRPGSPASRFRSQSHYEDCITGAIKVLAGEVQLPDGASYPDAIGVVEAAIRAWRQSIPESWRRLLLE